MSKNKTPFFPEQDSKIEDVIKWIKGNYDVPEYFEAGDKKAQIPHKGSGNVTWLVDKIDGNYGNISIYIYPKNGKNWQEVKLQLNSEYSVFVDKNWSRQRVSFEEAINLIDKMLTNPNEICEL